MTSPGDTWLGSEETYMWIPSHNFSTETGEEEVSLILGENKLHAWTCAFQDADT